MDSQLVLVPIAIFVLFSFSKCIRGSLLSFAYFCFAPFLCFISQGVAVRRRRRWRAVRARQVLRVAIVTGAAALLRGSGDLEAVEVGQEPNGQNGFDRVRVVTKPVDVVDLQTWMSSTCP